MPRCLDPTATVDLWLDSDEAIPFERRPVFVCRILSDRQWKAAVAAAAGPSSYDKAVAIMQASLVGWRNLVDPESGDPIPFAAANLDAVCDQMELVWLFDKLQLTYSDKKKFASPRSSATESSAEPAPPNAA